MRKASIIILLSTIVLAGCSLFQPKPEPTASPTRRPQSTTAAPTDTPTAVPPTNTPTRTISPTLTPSPTPDYPVEGYGPAGFPDDINPLTGLPVTGKSLLERRPLAVKIQLFPRSQRYPWGISLADVVFDYYQNAGITRLNAIFLGENAEQVGPIRSARIFDSSIVAMFKAIFGFGGADQNIINNLYTNIPFSQLVNGVASNCPPMCRIDPNGFNYLVTDTEALSDFITNNGLDNSRQTLDGWTFNYQLPEGGENAEQIFVRHSISAYTRWDYDAESGRYLRFQDTVEDRENGAGEEFEPFVDQLTDEQVSASNVVVLFVPHNYLRQPPGEIIEILLHGNGPAYAFRDGLAYEVEWNRPPTGDMLYLTFPDGERYAFKPGNTWFEVVGQFSDVSQPDEHTWRFVFGFP